MQLIPFYYINTLTATYPYMCRIDFVSNLHCIHFSGDLIILDLEGVSIYLKLLNELPNVIFILWHAVKYFPTIVLLKMTIF